MNTPDYDSLLLQYRSGNIVPVIGSELLKVVTGDYSIVPMEKYIVSRIEKKSLTAPDLLTSLTELAVERDNLSSEVPGIYNSIAKVKVDNRPYFNDNLLRLLARGKKFKYFISTAYDRRMEDILGNEAQVLTWNHTKSSPIQIEKDNNNKKLFYLFGKITRENETNEEVSYVDIDKMESLFNLSLLSSKNVNHEFNTILEVLQGKTLLFIGNNFQDWFMRLAIRVLCNTPFKDLRKKLVYIVNDSRSGINYEKYFIKKYGIELVHEYPVNDFVTTLMESIEQENDFTDNYIGKQVFISYDRQNHEIAESLNRKLRIAGINTWLDTCSLEIGDYHNEIVGKINSANTCLFICLLSEHLAGKDKEDSYVKRVEWEAARFRLQANSFFKSRGDKTEHFYAMPIALDNYHKYINKLPDFVRENQIYNIDNPQIIVDIQRILNAQDYHA